MIKFIVKRNRETEAFNASKLNKWMRWGGEELKDKLDWSEIILDVVRNGKETMHSQELQQNLIDRLKQENNNSGFLVAGKLLAVLIKKKFYGESYPTIKKLHKKLFQLNKMKQFSYSEEDYEYLETIIDHKRDMKLRSDNIEHITKKYSIKDEYTKEIYETPQFVYMRVAMFIAENESEITNEKERLERVKSLYLNYSQNRVNLPTPTMLFAGTTHEGLASCCLIMSNDTIKSMSAGHYASYIQTANSAGIGSLIACRSIKDPVRHKSILHAGKIPYLKAESGMVTANVQAGRAGAANSYFSLLDPEYKALIALQNPRMAEDLRNRKMHFSFFFNKFLLKKAYLKEEVFLFNCYTAPDLWEALFDPNSDRFEILFDKYLKDDSFKKTYVKANDLLVEAWTERYGVGSLYPINITSINRHTPFFETIYQSNLCVEITQPTFGYKNIEYLMKKEDHGYVEFKIKGNDNIIRKPYNEVCYENNQPFYFGGLKKNNRVSFDVIRNQEVDDIIHVEKPGEISMCSLAAVVLNNCKTEEEVRSACYDAVYTATQCVLLSGYPLPHVDFTAKNRLNVGVGVLGLAYELAKNNLSYSSLEGKQLSYRLAERHAYYCILASLEQGKKYGNAQWMHKTKWPRGWLPIDTGNKKIDTVVKEPFHYDWENLRQQIIENNGVRNSAIISYMPTESSSKSSMTTPNIYPIKNVIAFKTDQNNLIEWCAPESDTIGHQYENAFDISTEDLFHHFAIWQKFADQAGSWDTYKDRSKNPNILSSELLKEAYLMSAFDIKSLYYARTKTNNYEETSEEIKPITQEVSETEASFCSIDGACGC